MKLCLKLHKSQTGGNGIVKTCTMIKNRKELNKNIGSKSLHHFVQRLLVPSVRQQVAKPQVLPNEVPAELFKAGGETVLDRMHRICVRSGKTVSGQRNGRSPRLSHFPRKVILNSVQITE